MGEPLRRGQYGWMTVTLRGQGFADRGYISKPPMKHLWQRGLHLVISIHRTMKSHLIPLLDKPLPGKGSIIIPPL